MSLEEDILLRIKPDQDEERHIQEAVEALKERIRQTPSFKEVDIELYLVGSIARGTHLKAPDIDMFLLFDPSVEKPVLERVGVAIGREAVGGEEHYAEHPYIKGEFMGLEVDIVPAYKLKDAGQKMTAVDRTPFHTRYIIEHLDDGIREEIRLMKKFMKGIGVYGAEIKIKGFSGYLCELIVIRYGSFLGALKAVGQWRRHETIYFEGPSSTKFNDPLVFIDPVDPRRNVASPVSLDIFSRFVHAAREYLNKPDERFFFPKKYVPLSASDIEEIMHHRADIIGIGFQRPEGLIDDVFYGQLGKFKRAMVSLLENNDFSIIHSSYVEEGEKITIMIEMVSAELPRAKIHTGPPVWIHENAQDFVNRWKADEKALSSPFIEDGNWKVIIGREHMLALELIQASLPKLDIGKNLNDLKEDLVLIGHDDVIEKLSPYALSRFLDKRMSWEI